MKAGDDSIEFVYPNIEIANEETIKVFVWPSLIHRIQTPDEDSDPVASETPSHNLILDSNLKSNPQSGSVGFFGPQSPPGGRLDGSPRNIMELLLTICGKPSARSQLTSANLASFKQEVVQYLPTMYNGNVIFELPPLRVVKERGIARLDGTDQRFDGHAWIETATTNIVDPSCLFSFKYVKCMGHLRCNNPNCQHISEVGDYNEMYWAGSSPDVLTLGQSSMPSSKCKLICKHCKSTPSCLVLCPCRMSLSNVLRIL